MMRCAGRFQMLGSMQTYAREVELTSIEMPWDFGRYYRHHRCLARLGPHYVAAWLQASM